MRPPTIQQGTIRLSFEEIVQRVAEYQPPYKGKPSKKIPKGKPPKK